MALRSKCSLPCTWWHKQNCSRTAWI